MQTFATTKKRKKRERERKEERGKLESVIAKIDVIDV